MTDADNDDNRCYHCLTKYPLANRWAAFTDNELHCINDAIFISDQHERERTGDQTGAVPAAVSVEVQAELERRRA